LKQSSYCIGSDITTPAEQDGFIHIKTHLTSDSYESNTDFIKRTDPVYSVLLSKAAGFLASVLTGGIFLFYLLAYLITYPTEQSSS